MRKAIALFFLFIITLNIAGYYLVFEGWKYHNSISSVDDERSNSQELIIEIPISVPYVTQEKEWEKADGQFEYQGELYKIVKQKIGLDAVLIACVKDHEGNRINQQQEELAQAFSDKPVDAKQNVKTVPGFIKEYISNIVSVKSSVVGWSLEVAYISALQSLVPTFSPSIVHPPERIA
ncbi:MAG: hypothetical protein HOP08_13235 [Cyclobacteriaceae bacterium]|nr:hypothetical protein [Cyclobacteriaceae bacterium]